MKKKKEHTEQEKRFLKLIEELGLNKKTFALEIDVTIRTLHNYMYNNRIPNGENLIKIKERFNVDINWLLTGEGDMFLDSNPVIVLSERERELLKHFKLVSNPIQNGMISCLKTIYSEQNLFVK